MKIWAQFTCEMRPGTCNVKTLNEVDKLENLKREIKRLKSECNRNQ